MSALLAQAQQMQQKLMEAQHQLANAEVRGQAGGGLVEVVVKGSGEVVAVKIDPQARFFARISRHSSAVRLCGLSSIWMSEVAMFFIILHRCPTIFPVDSCCLCLDIGA